MVDWQRLYAIQYIWTCDRSLLLSLVLFESDMNQKYRISETEVISAKQAVELQRSELRVVWWPAELRDVLKALLMFSGEEI